MLTLCCRLIATLPLPVLRSIGTVAGGVAWLAAPRLRRCVSAHLAQAGLQAQPSLSTRRVVQATARGALDMVWVWFNTPSAVAARCWVDPHCAAHLAQAVGAHRATLLLTPHLGCFEALAKWFATQAPLTAMYRRPEKAWVSSLLTVARRTHQLTMAPADAGGVRIALKTLKNGGTVGILPDQAPRMGEGVWLPWFGRNAYTITLPAKLQAATQAQVFVMAALPCGAGGGRAAGWRIVCEPVAVPAGLDALQTTVCLNQALERMVLRDPLVYAWSYRRYKGTPPDEAQSDAAHSNETHLKGAPLLRAASNGVNA